MYSMNLRDLANPQYESVTGRKRKVPYASYLSSIASSVREAATQEREEALREEELAESARQFDLSYELDQQALENSQEQFNQSYALSQEELEQAKKEAETATAIQGGGLALAAGYLGDKTGLLSKLAGGSAAQTGTEAATAASQAGTSGYFSTYAPTLAEIAAIELAGGLAKDYVPDVAEALPGGEQEWNVATTVATRAGEGAVIGSVVPGVGTAVGSTIGAGVGLVESIFCFAAGAIVDMADGSTKAIEDLDLGDEVLEGGLVTAVGKSYAQEPYEHHDSIVEGSHAAFENGRWIRIRESDDAKPVDYDGTVYPVIVQNHILIINGRVYSDLSETGSGWGITEEQSLAKLNNMTHRNRYLEETYDN